MKNTNRILVALTTSFNIPWYFIVCSAYPVLSLLSSNVGQVRIENGWRPLLVSVVFGLLLFLACQLFLRDIYRSAFLSTLWMALFFSYGHVYLLIAEKWEKIQFEPYLWAVWLALAILFVVWATRPQFLFRGPVLSVNVIAVGLVLTSLVQIGSGVRTGSGHYTRAKNAPVQDLTLPQEPPDVYYFILDSYTRADLLEQAYEYDNSEFLAALRERGFYVAECSQTNYTRTELSLASSLNMSYLQDLDPAFEPESIKRGVLWDSLKHNAVRYNFDELGYTTINFATGFAWNEVDDVDLYFTPNSLSMGMTEFEVLFVNTTLARYINDWGWVDTDEIMGQNFRDRTLNVFDKVDDIARMPEPTFAYIHLISPHPPFVFGPDGEHTSPADFWNEKHQYSPELYEKGYVNQLTFLNKKMLEALDVILANSKTPPIIVLQGDHGPWLQPRNKHMWILNAYYLPGKNGQLYPSITPVNTFRLVFDAYFNGDYDMLPDVSYFSPVPKLYEFSKIPNQCKK